MSSTLLRSLGLRFGRCLSEAQWLADLPDPRSLLLLSSRCPRACLCPVSSRRFRSNRGSDYPCSSRSALLPASIKIQAISAISSGVRLSRGLIVILLSSVTNSPLSCLGGLLISSPRKSLPVSFLSAKVLSLDSLPMTSPDTTGDSPLMQQI